MIVMRMRRKRHRAEQLDDMNKLHSYTMMLVVVLGLLCLYSLY